MKAGPWATAARFPFLEAGMKFDGYYHRALKTADRRYRQAFERMGYGRRDLRAAEAPKPAEADEMTELRAEYRGVVGRRQYVGWGAGTRREKMAEATSAGDG